MKQLEYGIGRIQGRAPPYITNSEGEGWIMWSSGKARLYPVSSRSHPYLVDSCAPDWFGLFSSDSLLFLKHSPFP